VIGTYEASDIANVFPVVTPLLALKEPGAMLLFLLCDAQEVPGWAL
jgi:hypothetical protein